MYTTCLEEVSASRLSTSKTVPFPMLNEHSHALPIHDLRMLSIASASSTHRNVTKPRSDAAAVPLPISEFNENAV